MNKRRLYSLMVGLGVALAVALALVFGVFSPGADRGAGPETGATTSTEDGESGPALEASVSDVDVAPEGASEVVAAVDEPAPGSGGGPVEGIKVHGHWIIEVRDPDGSLVSRQEFDNALHPLGEVTLSELLARDSTLGGWQVIVRATVANDLCPTFCRLVEPTFGLTNPSTFKNLTVTAVGGTLELSGSFTAISAGSVDTVETHTPVCAASVTPNACPGVLAAAGESGLEPLFTGPSTVPGAPVSVLLGQEVIITVVISFS